MANENENIKTNVEIWEVKSGNVTAVKMFDKIFYVNKEAEEGDVLGIAEKFADVFHETPTVETPTVETPTVETPEKKRSVGRPRKASAPIVQKHVRVPQSRSDSYTPILDKEGKHIKVSGIPLYEEFKNVILEKFAPNTDFSTKDITNLFMEKFPEYSTSTLRNKAVAYDRYLRETKIARYTEINGVKRKIAIYGAQSATPNEILERHIGVEADILDGINA